MSKLIYFDYKPNKNIEQFETSIIIDNTITQDTFNTQYSNITSCGTIIINNSLLEKVIFNNLISCAGIGIENNNNLTTIEMPQLEKVQSKYIAIHFPDKFSDISISYNNKLTILNIPNIEILNNMTINNNNTLDNLNGFTKLKTINDSLIISNNSSLKTLSDLNLINIKNILEISNNDLLDMNKIQSGLTNITTLKDVTISNNNNLTSLEELRNIKTITGNFIIKNNKNLKTLYNLSSLYSINGNFEITNNAMLDICKTSLLTLDDLINKKIPTYLSTKNNLVGILPNYSLCVDDKFTLPISVNLDDALSAAFFRIKYSEYFEVIGSNFDQTDFNIGTISISTPPYIVGLIMRSTNFNGTFINNYKTKYPNGEIIALIHFNIKKNIPLNTINYIDLQTISLDLTHNTISCGTVDNMICTLYPGTSSPTFKGEVIQDNTNVGDNITINTTERYNLQIINGSLIIKDNPRLTTLEGIYNLNTVGSINISNNPNLILNGLTGLTNINKLTEKIYIDKFNSSDVLTILPNLIYNEPVYIINPNYIAPTTAIPTIAPTIAPTTAPTIAPTTISVPPYIAEIINNIDTDKIIVNNSNVYVNSDDNKIIYDFTNNNDNIDKTIDNIKAKYGDAYDYIITQNDNIKTLNIVAKKSMEFFSITSTSTIKAEILEVNIDKSLVDLSAKELININKTNKYIYIIIIIIILLIIIIYIIKRK